MVRDHHCFASRGRLTSLSQAPGYLIEAQPVTSNPSEDLAHHACLLRNRFESGNATALLRTEVAVSVRSTRHHTNVAGSGSMALATATAFHDLGALIFGNDALDLQQEVIFRALSDRFIEKDRLDAVAPPLV